MDLIVQRIYSNKVEKTGREETENEDFSVREKGDRMLIQKANGPAPTTSPALMHFELDLTQPLQTVAI